jgi:hypothetical protein
MDLISSLYFVYDYSSCGFNNLSKSSVFLSTLIFPQKTDSLSTVQAGKKALVLFLMNTRSKNRIPGSG